MEIFLSDSGFTIIAHGYSSSLFCNRIDGKLAAIPSRSHDLDASGTCIGQIYGVVGTLQPLPTSCVYLVLITKRSLICEHPLRAHAQIFRIDRVVALPLSTDDDLLACALAQIRFDSCQKHASHFQRVETAVLHKSKNNLLKMTKNMSSQLSTVMRKTDTASTVYSGAQDAINTSLDEILRLFNESCSFYYSPEADLTNSMQRLVQNSVNVAGGPLIDHRFFWNKYMLKDLWEDFAEAVPEHILPWLVPTVYGHIECKPCSIGVDFVRNGNTQADDEQMREIYVEIILISRRSLLRAGTRYLRRGLDEFGHCANYVETEQILRVLGQTLAFVQVRGSVPLFWSQPGYKYKPPPRIDRSKQDSSVAFEHHFKEQLRLYGTQVVVNLVEQTGKEQLLSDAFLDHVLDLNSTSLTYVTFDFHEHCRGMRFENISVLVEALVSVLQNMRFAWIDKKQEIACEQNGVFRVNCIDCLDRTNVVQTALAKFTLEVQLRKLGLLGPEESLPKACQHALQELWANNGDAISRQYAGTAALKGDFTRTGQRNLVGMMKDGYNSASRYYLCHVKDAKRQVAIDALLGNCTSPEVRVELESDWLVQRDEQLRLLVQDCQRLFLPDDEVTLGSWALIDAAQDSAEAAAQEDMDVVVMLCRESYYVAEYDDELDKFVRCQKVHFADVDYLEVGQMSTSAVLGISKTKATCLRVWYHYKGDGGYFHCWRAASTRLFNNMALSIKSDDDASEYVHAIAQQFSTTLEIAQFPARIVEGKLARKKSKVPSDDLPSQHKAMFGSTLLGTRGIGWPTTGVLSFKNVREAIFKPGRVSPRTLRKRPGLYINGGVRSDSIVILHIPCGLLFTMVAKGEVVASLQYALQSSCAPFRDDSTLLSVTCDAPAYAYRASPTQQRPMFTITSPEQSPDKNPTAVDKDTNSVLWHAHSTGMLAGTDNVQGVAMQSSRSDANLRNRVLGFASSSFNKLSKQMQQIGHKGSTGSIGRHALASARFAQYTERISECKSAIILL